MALEALKAYAAEQNQATQVEIDKLLKNDALKRPTSDEKGKGNIKPLVSNESVAEALQERLAANYKRQQVFGVSEWTNCPLGLAANYKRQQEQNRE